MAAMTTANRTSGLTPLAVFFDAVDATNVGALAPYTWTSGVVQPADILGTLYEWDFGDTTAGTWTQTGLSRNTATGFTAAHVYETPGTYVVTLTVTQINGTVTTYTQTIIANAFSGATYYIATNGSDSNNGTSTATPFATVAKGLSMAGANRQILFRRGDTWTGVAPQTISAAGPGIIGSYGTGEKPIWVSTASNNSNNPTMALTLAGSDWRAMDIEIRGTAWTALQVGGDYSTYIRCFVNGGSGIFAGAGSGGEWGVCYYENEISGCSTYGAYCPGRQMSVLGNNAHDIVASHIWRVPQMHKGVISHNRFWNAGPTRQAIKLHSDTAGGGGWDTRYVTISDNLWRSDLWSVSIGSQDAAADERPHQIVVERNRGYAAPGCTASLLMHSSDMIARNNVFDMTGCGNGCTAIWAVHMGTVVPVENNIRIYNNTVYRGGAADDFAGVAVSSWPVNSTASGPTNVKVQNNLVAAATAAGKYVVALDGITTSVLQGGRAAGAGLVNTNNLLNASPGFTNAVGGDFSITGSSPAVNTGVTLPEVRQDYMRLLRPAGVVYDIGAYEYGAAANTMTCATRTTGTAPLGVVFDAVDATTAGGIAPFNWTSGVYQPADYEGTLYEWDFGDSTAGTWVQTGLPRNTATGYVTGHLYETPGTYTATLTITPADGVARAYTQSITVSAFSGTTYYVAINGSDSNNGTSTSTPFLTVAKGLSMAGPNVRILFRRGDTFTHTTTNVTAAGPGIIGAYGSGNKPVLNSSGGISVSASDWRIMDVELVDTGSANSWGLILSTETRTDNVSFIRCKTTGYYVGLGWSEWGTVFTNPHAGTVIWECELNSPTTNGTYVGGYHLVLLGNNIHDIGSSHVVRCWKGHKAAISHNRLWNPGPTRHAIKLHSPLASSNYPDTRYVSITDNLVRGTIWSVAIGPQDAQSDERVHNVVYERNRHYGESSVQIDVLVEARNVLVRNNILDGTGASSEYVGVAVWQRGVEPTPDSVRVLHNTIVRNDSSVSAYALSVQSVATNVTLVGNIVSAPLTTTKAAVTGTAGSGFTNTNNIVSNTPGFTDAAGGNYTLSSWGAAVGASVVRTDVRLDYIGARRDASPDAGAFEYMPIVGPSSYDPKSVSRRWDLSKSWKFG
jgi:hypothetical protein